MNCGIYKILNLKNNKCYIGSSSMLKRRFNRHLSLLKRNLHHSNHLQNSWNKYGEACFKFEIIEFVNKEDLISREQFYLDNLSPEYNVLSIAGSTKGIIRSDEYKYKLHLANIGKKLKEEHKEKVSLNSAFSKSIYMIDTDNNIINEFRSISFAAKQTGIDRCGISMVCNKRNKTAGGYKWRFVNDISE